MSEHKNEGVSLGRLESVLGFMLLAAYRRANRVLMKHLNGLDITTAGFGVLTLVDANPGCAIGEVGRAMGIAPNNVARLVDRLCAREWIRKEVSDTDARSRSLYLTREGAEFLALLNARHTAYEDDFNKQVGDDRVDALRALLKPVITGADKDDQAT
jgi:DNA-binding MarR family transcriptional regulator